MHRMTDPRAKVKEMPKLALHVDVWAIWPRTLGIVVDKCGRLDLKLVQVSVTTTTQGSPYSSMSGMASVSHQQSVIFGFVTPSRKAAAKWERMLFLGKADIQNSYVAFDGQSILLTRTSYQYNLAKPHGIFLGSAKQASDPEFSQL